MKCSNVANPNKMKNIAAGTSEGLYSRIAPHASGGKYPFLPGSMWRQVGVGDEVAVVDADVVVGAMFVTDQGDGCSKSRQTWGLSFLLKENIVAFLAHVSHFYSVCRRDSPWWTALASPRYTWIRSSRSIYNVQRRASRPT